jgi:hypothetical protein
MHLQKTVSEAIDKVFPHGDGERTVRGIVSYNKLNKDDLLSSKIVVIYLQKTGWKDYHIMKISEELNNN